MIQAAQASSGGVDCRTVVANATGPSAGVLLDPNGALHRTYGAEDEALFLVRPDGYVGYRARPADATRLREYLRRIFV